MRRALRALVMLLPFAAMACGPTKPAIYTGTPARRVIAETDPCRGTIEPIDAAPPSNAPSGEPPWDARVAKVEIEGAWHVPRDLVRSAIRTTAGGGLDQATIAHDVRAIEALEAIETVRADVSYGPNDTGVTVRFVLRERRTIEAVTYRWSNPVLAGHWVPLAKGELYDPARIARTRMDLERNLIDAGNLDAKVEERHVVRDEKVHVCFIVEAGTSYVIDRISFTGNDHVSQSELLALLHTHEHRVNEAGTPFREDLLETDLLYVSALYYDRGHLSVKVGPAKTTSANGKLAVEIPISEGPVYRIKSFRFTGFGPAAEHMKRIGVKNGDVFNRSKVLEGIDKIRALHRKNGIDVVVTPETALDSAKGEVSLTFVVTQVKK